MRKIPRSEYFLVTSIFLFFLFFTFYSSKLQAQNDEINIAIVKVRNNDTLYVFNLNEILVEARAPFGMRMKIRKYNRLERNIKKVYPYARLAAVKLVEYEEMVLLAKNEAEKKALTKQAEENLRDEFEDDIVDLNFRQGILLIKLIERETGDTSYEIIQELRGKLMAFFWQTFAKIFGYDLKIKYDPFGEDKDIEGIVQMIERGEL